MEGVRVFPGWNAIRYDANRNLHLVEVVVEKWASINLDGGYATGRDAVLYPLRECPLCYCARRCVDVRAARPEYYMELFSLSHAGCEYEGQR